MLHVFIMFNLNTVRTTFSSGFVVAGIFLPALFVCAIKYSNFHILIFEVINSLQVSVRFVSIQIRDTANKWNTLYSFYFIYVTIFLSILHWNMESRYYFWTYLQLPYHGENLRNFKTDKQQWFNCPFGFFPFKFTSFLSPLYICFNFTFQCDPH